MFYFYKYTSYFTFLEHFTLRIKSNSLYIFRVVCFTYLERVSTKLFNPACFLNPSNSTGLKSGLYNFSQKPSNSMVELRSQFLIVRTWRILKSSNICKRDIIINFSFRNSDFPFYFYCFLFLPYYTTVLNCGEFAIIKIRVIYLFPQTKKINCTSVPIPNFE